MSGRQEFPCIKIVFVRMAVQAQCTKFSTHKYFWICSMPKRPKTQPKPALMMILRWEGAQGATISINAHSLAGHWSSHQCQPCRILERNLHAIWQSPTAGHFSSQLINRQASSTTCASHRLENSECICSADGIIVIGTATRSLRVPVPHQLMINSWGKIT